MLQFRIRNLFLSMLGVASLLACLYAAPDLLGCALLAMVSLAMLPLIAGGVCFGRGAARAFAIGAATLSWLTVLLYLATFYLLVSFAQGNQTSLPLTLVDFIRQNSVAFKTMHLANALLLGLAGGLSVAVRAWSLRGREKPSGEEVRAEEQVIAAEESAPTAAPQWRLLRMDGSHTLAGPTLGGDQPVASAGNIPDTGEDDRPIRRPR